MKHILRIHLPCGDSIDMVPQFTFAQQKGTLADDALQNVATMEVLKVLSVSGTHRLEVVKVS